MMIRFFNVRNTGNAHRRGVSLAELAYALAVISVVLGVVWAKAGDIYQDLRVQNAGQELQSIAQTARLLHPNGKLSSDDSWNGYNFPPDMVGHFHDRTIVFDPWRGAVSLFPGNAMLWGADKSSDEFTIGFDGVPPDACTEFVMSNSAVAMRSLGLIAIFITPEKDSEKGKGQEICFAADAYCKNTVTELSGDMIKLLCHAHNPMVVMFTYTMQ